MAEAPGCGSCTMCCKLLGIKELSKPKDKWCNLCKPGVGCTAYDSRPPSCQEFECLWLQSQAQSKVMGLELKPDRCKAVLSSTLTGTGIVVYVDTKFPNAHRVGALGRFIDNIVGAGLPVVIVCGEKRTLLALDKQKYTYLEVETPRQ